MAALEGFDIIALTFADWHANWSTPQQLMCRLAPKNRVLYVDQPRSVLFGLKGHDTLGSGAWEGPLLREVQENLFVYHPPHVFLPIGNRLPLPVAKPAFRANGRLLAALIGRQARSLGFNRPILWNFSILHGTAVPWIDRRITIYDICDEWVNYIPHESGRRITRWVEDRLVRDADLVFTGTENQRTPRVGLNAAIHVVHHAADFVHFAKAGLPETPIPEEMAGLRHPVIGSVGVMDGPRFNVGLIEHLAVSRPDWSIVLVGPAREDLDISRLRTFDNVYLLGNKPIAELPGYLKGMDVVIIPYLVNSATRDIYPLKLQEYLSTGKPVVSSALPAVLPYGDVVAIADSDADFVGKISAALEDTGPERFEARQAVARRNSWEQRVEEKSALILERLAALAAGREGGTEA